MYRNIFKTDKTETNGFLQRFSEKGVYLKTHIVHLVVRVCRPLYSNSTTIVVSLNSIRWQQTQFPLPTNIANNCRSPSACSTMLARDLLFENERSLWFYFISTVFMWFEQSRQMFNEKIKFLRVGSFSFRSTPHSAVWSGTNEGKHREHDRLSSYLSSKTTRFANLLRLT